MLHRYSSVLISYVLIVFFGSPLFAVDSDQLRYTLRPLVNEEKLEVELTFQGSADGYTVISYPPSLKEEDDKGISNLSCYAKNKRRKIDRLSCPGSYGISHKPKELLTVKYHLIKPKEKNNGSKSLSTYALDKTFFQFSGQDAFITPDFDDDEKKHITLEWKDLPSKWVLANSFDINKTTQDLFISLHALSSGLYVGGELDISRCWDSADAPYIAIRNGVASSYKPITKILKTIIQTQRDFWNDHDFPHYLIVLLPSNRDQYINAVASLNAFFVNFPDYSCTSEDQCESLSHVLSHEHFHTWNPYKMFNGNADINDLSWFMEGFTDYYAFTLNCRAQLLDPAGFIDEINDHLYKYHTSRYRNVDNELLKKERWTNAVIQELPYQRGCLLALLWDYKIKQKTVGKHSLDDVMRNLFARVQNTSQSISISDIEESVGEYLGAEASSDLQKYIHDGETITPPENLFGGDFVLQSRKNDPDSIPQYRSVKQLYKETPKKEKSKKRKILVS